MANISGYCLTRRTLTLISHARDYCVMDVLPWVGWVGFRGPFIGITSRSTFQIRSVFDKHRSVSPDMGHLVTCN